MQHHQSPPISTEAQLHRTFLEALGSNVRDHSDIRRRPVDLSLNVPLPYRSRLYLFNCTLQRDRSYYIQLRMPGQRSGERGSFDFGDDRHVLLMGYEPQRNVFVLWDAYLYLSFGLNNYVGVRADILDRASAGLIAEQSRWVRTADAAETVVAARTDYLADALVRRVEISRRRILGG